MRRLILILILACPAFPQAMFFGQNKASGGGGGGPSLFSHAAAGSMNNNSVTAPNSGSINGSGATLITVGVGFAGTNPCVPTDSSSNTYTLALSTGSGTAAYSYIYYVRNPTVTSAMTFSCSQSFSYPVLNVLVWRGTATAGGPDVTHGNGSGGSTSTNGGPITPTMNNEVCAAQLMTAATEGSTPTVSSPFTVEDSIPWNTNVGGTSAYQIQTTATTENPTYSWTNSIANAVSVACFQ